MDREQVKHWQVLVVDDEPDSVEVVTRVLRFYGVTVYTANNGKEALQSVRQFKPTFILSDLSMPVMDGWEFLFNLKEDAATAAIPVIALTAHGMQGDRDRALAAGFHYYLTKPLSPLTFIDDLMRLFAEAPNPVGMPIDVEALFAANRTGS
jgi:CheY-like chemotaxis protein